jgi:hypothetical protein
MPSYLVASKVFESVRVSKVFANVFVEAALLLFHHGFTNYLQIEV